jgi:hypothetical protein
VNPGPGLTRAGKNPKNHHPESKSGPMKQIANTLVNTTAPAIDARHRVATWCVGTSEQFASYMPNTKHQRLREPSPG